MQDFEKIRKPSRFQFRIARFRTLSPPKRVVDSPTCDFEGRVEELAAFQRRIKRSLSLRSAQSKQRPLPGSLFSSFLFFPLLSCSGSYSIWDCVPSLYFEVSELPGRIWVEQCIT
ncbi:hypothetical protein TNCV_4526031 [Trichonephila clavipes]|nr:hypothetical protein TNCV_4526031 [Trichonephila clavipes]